MGTTSQKLEYLNGTKNSLKSAINNLGGAIDSNTTFRAYASELDTIYDNLPKASDTGTNVSLSPTLKGRLGIVPKGNTLQDGEPTPETPVEIQSATGTQKVVVSGKNLFDEITELGRIDVNTGQNVADNNYLRAKNYISVTPNTNYYIFIGSLGTTSSDWIAVETYDKNKNFISNLGSKINKTTFTTPNDCYYIRLYYGSGYGTIYKNDTAIIKGTSGTYQPYQEPQEVDIELGNIELNKIGDYEDYIDGTPDNWVLYKNIGKKTPNLTSSSVANLYMDNTTFNKQYKIQQAYSNCFQNVVNTNITDNNTAGNLLNDNQFSFRWGNENARDRLYIKSSLTLAQIQSLNIELLYVLATGTTETITEEPLVSQLNELYYLQSYNDTTNIDVTGNLPMRITASAIKGS